MNAIKLRLLHFRERFARISLIVVAMILVVSVFIVMACNRQEPTDKQDRRARWK